MSAVEAPEKTIEKEWVTAKERCDACPSQSYYMVVFETGELFFCRHHYLQNEASFYETAVDVIDESELLPH